MIAPSGLLSLVPFWHHKAKGVLMAGKPSVSVSTPSGSSSTVTPEVAGPLSVFNFEVPSWMTVPPSIGAAIADGTTDALAEGLVERAAVTFLDPIFSKIPVFGEMVVALPGYQTFRGITAIGILYGMVAMDDRYVRNQIADGNLAPKSYVPPAVAALVLKAARRKAGDVMTKVLPLFTGFIRDAKKDIDSALGSVADPSGAPTS